MEILINSDARVFVLLGLVRHLHFDLLGLDYVIGLVLTFHTFLCYRIALENIAEFLSNFCLLFFFVIDDQDFNKLAFERKPGQCFFYVIL